MGIYAEYLDKGFDWPALNRERKNQLKRIEEIRNRPILVYASAISKNAPININYEDRLPLLDQLRSIQGKGLDLLLETPGGSAEIVEDIVEAIRNQFDEFAVIVPGWAKSAGTLMVMAADEILMEPSSALGPIDAQMTQNGKHYAAHAFLEGLVKIKEEVNETKELNRAYIPILQNISPGEIQGCENALEFSQKLVTEWLSTYKFKFWKTHLKSGIEVTDKEKQKRAKEIAKKLCDHGHWLTHGRSITLSDLTGPDIRLVISDYSKQDELCDAIRRYYTLLKMTFDTTNMYKVIETPETQIFLFATPSSSQMPKPEEIDFIHIDFDCPNCHFKSILQANLKPNIPPQKNAIIFPKDDLFNCPSCKSTINLGNLRKQIESQTKKHII